MSDTNAMRTRIASELNRSLTDNFGNSGETFATAVNREINAAIKHYESTRFRWNEIRESEFATTVAGTRTYSLPADFLAMDTLKIVYSGNYQMLKRDRWGNIEEMDVVANGSSRGVPDSYAIYGNILRLFSVPNGAYTMVASYIQRPFPTSLTGSYTTVIPVAGSYSLTVTTTASHNNRTNGWMQDGDPLIRARAKASILVNYLGNETAISEMRQLQAQGDSYLSVMEKIAFERMADETFDMLSTGLIKPYCI